MYGSSAPPPPPMMNGSLPSRRLQTQPQPQHEMPSCVQNAMMTKDKKPFTYTPGGIDLSQIKSPRMAQRISRNANMEGVTNQPKPSPLAQQNHMNTGAVPSPPPLSLGMPVQVFPQGPPPPPPVPKSSQLNVNGNRSPSVTRKSPQPQSFEPPPIGFRPEIKIPANPMAALKKVPPPKPKEVDWSEEFRRERSKSPMPPTASVAPTNTYESQAPERVQEFNNNSYQNNKPTYDKVDSPINTMQSFLPRQTSYKENDNASTDQNNNYSSNNYGSNFGQNSPQQRVFSPFASSPQPNLPKPLSPVKLNSSNLDENVPIYVRSSQRAPSPKPPTPQYEQGQSSPVSYSQRQPPLEQGQTPIYTRSQRNVSASPVQSTFQSNANDSQNENYPIYVRSFQKQPAPSPPVSSQSPVSAPANTQQPLSTANQSYGKEPGRQYYQPSRPTNTSNGAQMPPWMRRTNSKELPEWASNAEEPNQTSASTPTPAPTQAPAQAPQNHQQNNNYATNSNYSTNSPTTQYPNNTATQYGNNGTSFGAHTERVVPIQFEQSPVKTPTTPGFSAQPYQSTPPQYNRVQPPPFSPTGYNNVQNWNISQNVVSPTPKSNDGSRVIPIKLEDGHPYLSGPVSQTPHVIQSDARSTPNQSKSFRVLQQITDTVPMDSDEKNAQTQPAELHQPHFSRPLGPNDMNEHQLRKMKLNDDAPRNQTFESRFQQQFPDWVQSKPSTAPFSVLQSVMRPDNDGPGYSDL